MGNRLLKLTVILLCSINAAMWELYTESPLMALGWLGIAFAFFIWILDDIRRY
ncbi:MAG TPA: hypothetical protein VG429_01170 [Casimicrobiaceae bacterium]|jgi:hypothetical protein|nr:hypothetical protein [Casimicrobiaceae bacterium]